VENDRTVLLDTSTAHRTDSAWAYGFPELSEKHYEKIKNSKRIAVPGCHASGFIALVYPLIEKGILSKDAHLTCFSLTGYSGGGKKMIAEYEEEGRNVLLGAPRQYALAQKHKHLPEMSKIAGLEKAPVCCPIVGDFYSGMEVTVPLFADDINGGIDDIKAAYAEKYNGNIVKYTEAGDENGFISAGKKSGTDAMEISVFGNEERILLTARYDNLGKGACGAAIECLNIVLGADMTEGMNI
jgi:N-acetyl-gamma-glutamyl-phosphate reductase